MGKKVKLYARAKNNQRNLRFSDFCMLMEYFGFARTRVKGSHHLYQHPDLVEVMNVQPTKENLAKAYQVRAFLQIVEANNLQLEDD